MSCKDMFRKEQRFSFRKFSFGLASAVIANVIFGGAIASSPVVHANTVTEAQATAVSETGEVSVKAPANQEVDITVPVTVTYPDNSTDTVDVSFKVNQEDLAQLKAKKAIDDKLADAIKELEAKRDEALAEIDNDLSLREEQRKAAKDAITAVAGDALKDLENKAIEAKENIDKATTISEIDDAKVNGESALINAEDAGEKAINQAKEKELAKADVENKAFEALEKVNSNPNLSDDDKQAHFDDINATKETAIEKINSTEDAEAITAAIDEAEIAYKEDILNAAQLDALNKLEKDSEETKAAIDANPNLTPEEKAKAIAKVDELVNNTESDILSQPTPEKVQAVEDKADKDLAKVELQAAADDAKKGIEANPNLIPEEKDVAKKAVEDAVKVATDAIDKASTPAEVDTATSDGVKAIDAEEFKATPKDAKNKIDKEAELAKNMIDANPNLTPQEKESAKNAVEEAAKVATDAINKASTPGAVQVEEDKGVAAINLITATAEAKGVLADEIKELEAKRAEAEKAIDASTMTNEEKAIAKKALQDVVDKGKAELEDVARVATNEIHKATTAEDAKATALAGEKSLTDTGKEARDAVELAKDKELAKEAIRTEEEEATRIVEKLAENALKAINSDPNLSDEAKEAEIKKLTDVVIKTLETIHDNADKATQEAEKAQALADLEKAKETQKIADKVAIDELNLLVKDGELEATKRDVLNQLEKDAARAKEDIAKNPNLTKEQVDKALEDVQKDFDKAKTAINEATTPDAVRAEMDKGVAALAKDVLDAAKQDAKNKIAKDAVAAKEAIASNPNLSDEAKEATKKAVDTDAQAATDAIDKALKPDAVQAEEDKGVAAITKDVLDAAKQDAKNKIDKEAAAAKEAIASNPNLTAAEKKTFTDAVDAEVAKANDAISAATSPADVQKEEDAGVAAIAEDVLDAAKQDAKNKIAKESAAAKSVIDSNPNLTDAAKEAAKSEIDKAVEEAIVLINGVRTHQELEKIKLPMAALIKPAAKVTPVVDPNNLTEKEIARIKAFLKENNNLPEGTEINVSKDASVTIKYPDGTIDLLSPVEVVKQADKTAPTVANDGKGNIVIVPSEKAVEIVVTYVDNNGKPQTVVVTKGADGKWTTTAKAVFVDPVTGQVIIPGSAIKPGTVVTAYSKDEVGNSSDSAEAEVVAVDENNSATGVKVKSVTTNANNVEKKAKQLPNTGEEANSATSLGLVALGLGLALLAAKRRRDEEA